LLCGRLLDALVPPGEARPLKHMFTVVHEHMPNGRLYWDYGVAGVK
jgi:hypothetical protein